ncbi:type II toxin-antitoxin system RelB family antitoxin [Hydrogenimonas cancrithermarum]|uniref:CopG family transcriptional regulator n=1 Tax=Hydrogenimonas cancrithermarum TaxID=2993563 RepID=A0ABM8FP19_9BACT|nr:ribbon-helix-helix domain-containing protein [Hydrogenimonas cancrithermarum]BDY13397.1 hypothetical protein HCR_17090 [Hydrogenimonas cancrithermarum]
MISVRLDKEMEEKLEKLAKETKRPISSLVKEALENYLEDMIDYHEVMKRKNDPHRESITLEEIEKELGL